MPEQIVDLTQESVPLGVISMSSAHLDLRDASSELVIVENEEVMIERGLTDGGVLVAQTTRGHAGKQRPPHLVNYRAILQAFKAIGVQRVVAVSAAGSLQKGVVPGSLVVPDQMVMWSRSIHTVFSADHFGHADMTNPYCESLRSSITESAGWQRLAARSIGTYFSVAGPRFETAAEVTMFAGLGGSVVGMTTGPECVFARELGLCYAAIVMVTNFGAGIAKSVEIEHVKYGARAHAADSLNLLSRALELIDPSGACACSRQPTLFGSSIETKATDR